VNKTGISCIYCHAGYSVKVGAVFIAMQLILQLIPSRIRAAFNIWAKSTITISIIRQLVHAVILDTTTGLLEGRKRNKAQYIMMYIL